MRALGEVVDNRLLEAQVRVDKQRAAEDGVGSGIEGSSSEGRERQRDKTGGDSALKGPVVGAVYAVGFGDGGRVVDWEKSAF